MSSLSEPRMIGKHSRYICSTGICDVDNYFTKSSASTWCIENFVKKKIDDPFLEITFDQLFINFETSLDQINQLHAVPVSVRSFCNNYIKWLKIILCNFLLLILDQIYLIISIITDIYGQDSCAIMPRII
jgi:hypothetical protein